MGDHKLCYGCFEPINDEVKCPVCGYKQKSPYSPSYIAPGTMLNEKYMVGKLLSHNGEGATYLAFDTGVSCKILIKEYMPDALCTRVKGSPVINVNHNNIAQYKSLMAEFTELNKKLAKLRSQSHINPVLDLFTENNTTYAVYEYIEGKNLMQYLKENAGELSWEKVMKMFPPLFTSLSQLHNAGIIHRGISPQTIYVTDKEELKLTDFCIAAVRTTKTELNAEIFKGYAAPEQYSPSSWQGTWTDVYGICSVLYRILTGCMPTEASSRDESDELTSPSEINSDIPENVSKAIMDGMTISGDERIKTITELVTRIFEPSEENIKKTVVSSSYKKIVSNVEKKEESHEQISDNEKKKKREVVYEEEEEEVTIFDRIKYPVLILLLLLAVIAFLVGIIKKLDFIDANNGNSLQINLPALTTPPVTEATEAPQESSEEGYLTNVPQLTIAEVTTVTETSENTEQTESSVNNNIQMRNFVGMQYEDVMLSSMAKDVSFEVEYVIKEGHAKGEVLAQSVKENDWIVSGEVVKLTVCKGNGSATVPNFKKTNINHYPIDEFLAILDEAGISYKAVPEVNTGYASGYVIGTEPEAGTVIDISDVVVVHFTDNSGNGSVRLSPGVSASAQSAN